MPNLTSHPRYLDLDTTDRLLEESAARELLNVRGMSSVGENANSLENIKSMVQLNVAAVSGDDFVVGSISHGEKNDLYIFMWNSEANHRILRYNSITGNIDVILNSSLLGFTKTCFISGFAITSQSPSDTLLYWTDGVTQPKKINVTRAKKHTNGDYTNG